MEGLHGGNEVDEIGIVFNDLLYFLRWNIIFEFGHHNMFDQPLYFLHFWSQFQISNSSLTHAYT